MFGFAGGCPRGDKCRYPLPLKKAPLDTILRTILGSAGDI